MNLLSHLLDPTQADIVLAVETDIPAPSIKKNAAPLPLREELSAKKKTADLLAAWEQEENPKNAVEQARAVFEGTRELKTLTTPAAIQKVHALLDTYDYAIVEDARKIRNFVVNRLVEEADNPDPRVRLKAVELLGKVTEVAAFTERTEVRTNQMTEDDLNKAINKRLQALSRHLTPGSAEPPEDAKLVK